MVPDGFARALQGAFCTLTSCVLKTQTSDDMFFPIRGPRGPDPLPAQTSDALKKSRRRFSAVFGPRGPSAGPGTVKKRFGMENRS